MIEPVKFVVLVIIDGWGLASPGPQNAISLARTPNMDRLGVSFLHCPLAASGEDVGLPAGEMGNSEVGHLNLGAGRIVHQDLVRINTSIADGSFFLLEPLIEAFERAKKLKKAVHLLGLVSPGGVHSSMDHLFAILRMAKEHDFQKVYIHAFTDGRDTAPRSFPSYLTLVEKELNQLGVGQIASVMGRYYAMDRDLRWQRTARAYDALTLGTGLRAMSALEAVQKSYQQNRTDEFVLPTSIVKPGQNSPILINDGDSVIFFNFRTDRPRQLTGAFVLADFESAKIRHPSYDPYLHKHKTIEPKESPMTFRRKRVLHNLYFVTLTQYDKALPTISAFLPITVQLPLARVLSELNISQYHLAETEKYPHVTYFFNGGREEPFLGETREMVPSPQVATYDLEPEMATDEITIKLIQRLRNGNERFFLLNYAAPDMVGHTGVISAAVKACEAVDRALGTIVKEVTLRGGACIITSDHGNVEIMLTASGGVETEHSSSTVPFILVHEKFRDKGGQLRARLADVAPTILNLMGINPPSSMTGKSIISIYD